MKLPAKMLSLAALLLAATAAQAGVQTYYTTFTPEGGGGRTGTGSATATFDDSTNVFSVSAVFSGLSGLTTASHFHCCTTLPFTGNAIVAVDSPTLPIPLGVSAGTFTAELDLDDSNNFNPAFITLAGGTMPLAIAAFVSGLNAGNVYLNIHSNRFPGGEIRGYMQVPEPTTAALALLALAGLGVVGAGRRRSVSAVSPA